MCACEHHITRPNVVISYCLCGAGDPDLVEARAARATGLSEDPPTGNACLLDHVLLANPTA